MEQKNQEERRKSQQHFKGDERRQYSENEMPRDPTPGNPGKEAAIEKGRLDRGDKKGSEEA
jgi:hypothetical protein